MRAIDDTRRWMTGGQELFDAAVAGLSDAGIAQPSLLPGWCRGNVIAHVAANADAIGNLIHWAATGEETAMYASPEDRAAGIAKGVTLSPAELRAWLSDSVGALAAAMDGLTPAQWQCEVRTVQGRTVPVTETLWMRAREVCVHAVDLGTGCTFADLPSGFCEALSEEIREKRGLDSLPASVAGAPLPEVAAWLAGRPYSIANAPELGPWL